MERSNVKIIIFTVYLLIGWYLIPLWSQQNIPNLDTWMTNGWVNAILSTENVTYIAGEFNYLGKPCGHGLPIDISTGAIKSNYSKVDGNIYHAVSDGNGGWYICGNFSNVGCLSQKNLAHILPDGTVDPNWICSIYGSAIYTLARDGNTLYMGGQFSIIKGQRRNNICAMNLITGDITSWNPDSDDYISEIYVNEDIVYVGGYFSHIGGQKKRWVAAINKNTGLATDWDPKVNCYVLAIAAKGNSIYLGGLFSSVGGTSRQSLAAVDAVSGQVLPWNLPANQWIREMAIVGNILYLAGDFTAIGGQTRKFIASVDINTGQLTNWAPTVNGRVFTFEVIGNLIYLGGDFTKAGGQEHNHIAILDIVAGNPIPMNASVDGHVSALAVSGNSLYIGGGFSFCDGKHRQGLAAIDNSTGLITAWNPNKLLAPWDWQKIKCLALNANTLYVGGYFYSFGGQPRRHIAAVDAQTGKVTAWNPDLDGGIATIAVNGNTLYVGGSFSHIQNQPRKYFTAIDCITGEPIPIGRDLSINGYVNAITLNLNKDKIYIGGSFTSVGSSIRKYIAAFDLKTDNLDNWNPGTDNVVNTIKLSGNKLYVGGSFHQVGGYQRNHVAVIDASTGLVSDWNPSPNNDVLCILKYADIVYLGGQFTHIAGQNRLFIAAVDALTGQATPFQPNINAKINSMGMISNTLFVGGDFTKIGLSNCFYLARFDNAPPTYLISGMVSDQKYPIHGAVITFSHNNDITTTDAYGNYSYLVNQGTTTTVTPYYIGCKDWSPPSRILTYIIADQNGQNFKGNSIPFMLTSPNGDENWMLGMTKDITWLSPGFSGNIDLLLLKDNKKMGYIAQHLPIESGSYRWIVGKYSGGIASEGTGYKVMACIANTNIVDDSDRSFTIGSPPINLLSPNGRESWELGTLKNITWTSSGLTGFIRLSLLKNGVGVGNIATRIPIEAGSYPWVVGNYSGGIAAPGGGYKVKIRTEGDVFFDTSNSSFNICATQSIYVDHHCLDIDRIPEQWIEETRRKVRLYLSGSCLSEEIVKGLEILSRQNPRWNVHRCLNEFIGKPAREHIVFSVPWLINEPLMRLEDILQEPQLISKLKETTSYYNLEFLMFICDRESSKQKPLISDDYLRLVSRWENEFNPGVKVIYSTISGTKGSPSRELDNEKIRKYCSEKGNVLFDMADIESWYKENEFREKGFQALHPLYMQDEKGIRERCLNKARAFWWLAARLAGWPGSDK